MTLLKLIKTIQKCLSHEDELHLSFIVGYRLGVNEYFRNLNIRHTGVFLRSLVFFKFLINKLCFSKKDLVKTDFLIFAGTDNQFRSLHSTIQSLQKLEENISLVLNDDVSCPESQNIKDVYYVSYSFQEILTAFSLFIVYAPKLYLRLRKFGNKIGIQKYFDTFCHTYLYLPYFINLLGATKPSFIIISNDHNVENRCLRLAGKILGIHTVFMQHGSGSEYLPPLEFDFAFLDGWVSVEKYIACNKSSIDTYRKLQVANTTIVLSGLKKNIILNKKKSADLVFGVAINPHDDFFHVKKMLQSFIQKGINIIVRAHPMQNESHISQISELEKRYKQLSTSSFADEPVNTFLSKCSLLIAGNSGIHLEAAIAHIPTYYYEFGQSNLPKDYYRHLQEGISRSFPVDFDSLTTDNLHLLTTINIGNEKNIRRFSESFDTSWEGKEGMLVAKTLIKIKDEKVMPDFYTKSSYNKGFKAIYQLTIPS